MIEFIKLKILNQCFTVLFYINYTLALNLFSNNKLKNVTPENLLTTSSKNLYLTEVHSLI